MKRDDLSGGILAGNNDLPFGGNKVRRLEFLFGEMLAHFTKEGVDAIKLLNESEGIVLEGTYSGKAFAALLDNVKKDDTVLFWNTYCAESFEDTTKDIDYKNLPPCFRCYFEEDVQLLDR